MIFYNWSAWAPFYFPQYAIMNGFCNMSLIEEAHKLLLSKPSIELGARKSCVKVSPMDKKTDCEKIISIRNRFMDKKLLCEEEDTTKKKLTTQRRMAKN